MVELLAVYLSLGILTSVVFWLSPKNNFENIFKDVIKGFLRENPEWNSDYINCPQSYRNLVAIFVTVLTVLFWVWLVPTGGIKF